VGMLRFVWAPMMNDVMGLKGNYVERFR
jgi:hypothetical protein